MRFDGKIGHDDLTALRSFALDFARLLKVHVGGERHTVTGDVTQLSIITVLCRYIVITSPCNSIGPAYEQKW